MKLHLGCGKKYIEGFLHYDTLDAKHIDKICDIRSLKFIENDCVELIYASHVLEHFGRHELVDVLKEWYRVLIPGGVLRLAVPDFESISVYYQANGDLKFLIGLIVGGQSNEYDFHKSVFDYATLSELLKLVGFGKVNKYDWATTEHASLDDYSQAYLPHMDKENGMLMSLNVEAVKC